MEGFGPHQTPTLEENQFYKDRMTTNDQGGGGLVLIFLGTTTFTYSIQEEKKAGNNLFYN